jgi:hypothetical protein
MQQVAWGPRRAPLHREAKQVASPALLRLRDGRRAALGGQARPGAAFSPRRPRCARPPSTEPPSRRWSKIPGSSRSPKRGGVHRDVLGRPTESGSSGFKPDWTGHDNAAPCKRNGQVFQTMPIGVAAFRAPNVVWKAKPARVDDGVGICQPKVNASLTLYLLRESNLLSSCNGERPRRGPAP